MKKAVVTAIITLVVVPAVAVIAEAQQPGRVPRIGYLTTASTTTNPARSEAFRQGLRELGWYRILDRERSGLC